MDAEKMSAGERSALLGEAMKIQTNASTDDLLSLGSGNQTPESVHVTMNSTGGLEPTTGHPSSQNITPVLTPHQTPSIRRKSRNTLRLNLDEATWSQAVDPSKTQAATKLRQNLQAGAARVSAVVQRGKTPEFRFRLVLVFLFGSIIALITITYYLYQRHMLQLTFGDKIRFIEVQREIHLLTDEGKEVLRGTVGQLIPPQLSPFDCQLKYPYFTQNRCVEWKYRALLKINYTHTSNLSCYNVHWKSLSRTTQLRDCFSLSGAHWYGMGEVYNSSWPLTGIVETPHAFITGDLSQNDFGAVLERYWLSSRGVAIRVSPDVPLYISLNISGDEQLCLEAKHDGFPYYYSDDGLPFLEYTICTGPNMKVVHEHMIKKFFALPNTTINTEFLETTVWDTGPVYGSKLTPAELQKYADTIASLPQIGFMVIDCIWQWRDEVQDNSTTSQKSVIQVVHNKGFKILASVNPYICMGSEGFEDGIKGQYFLSDTKWKVPLLTRWQDKVCAIIDITDNSSAEWFRSRVEEVKELYNIDGFVFRGGQSSFLPRYYKFRNMDKPNPDHFFSHYLSLAAQTSPLTGVSFGFRTQNIPAFVKLSPRTSTWDGPFGLQSIIPTVLTFGLLGYPLVNPGSVGGDLLNGTKVEDELYMRWLQLAAFMPVMQLSAPPVYELNTIKTIKLLLKIRQERVLPVMKDAIQEYLVTGAPIIRPLWWLEPNNTVTHTIDSQFVVGNEIIVAPVLVNGSEARDVYLPPGRWRDEIQGNIKRGGKWIYNYSVPDNNIAYFTRED